MTTKNIMCFGDSLTHGWVPVAEGVPTTRYDADVRWTGVLADRLGDTDSDHSDTYHADADKHHSGWRRCRGRSHQ